MAFQHRLFQTLARTISPAKRPLSRLKTLDLCSHSEGSTLFSLDHHASGILEVAHDSLETLNLYMCGAARLRIGENRLHLRHLRLTRSCLSAADFGLFLKACGTGFETLVYKASYPPLQHGSCVFLMSTADVGTRPLTYRLLCHLVKFRATLKSLRFDLRSRRDFWDGACTNPGKPFSATGT